VKKRGHIASRIEPRCCGRRKRAYCTFPHGLKPPSQFLALDFSHPMTIPSSSQFTPHYEIVPAMLEGRMHRIHRQHRSHRKRVQPPQWFSNPPQQQGFSPRAIDRPNAVVGVGLRPAPTGPLESFARLISVWYFHALSVRSPLSARPHIFRVQWAPET
jgi:hypothetical protein